MTAHLKTFAKWILQHSPFRLGQPMAKILCYRVGNHLEIERALTKQERWILDAADQLLLVGGRSRDPRLSPPLRDHATTAQEFSALSPIAPSFTPRSKPVIYGFRWQEN